LRQSFVNGTLTRLIDPDRVLKTRIVEFVSKGEFGLASGDDPAGGYRRIWFREDIDPADVAFEAGVYLLARAVAERPTSSGASPQPPKPPPVPEPPTSEDEEPKTPIGSAIISIAGTIPPEQWNRLGTRLIPKLRAVGTVTAAIRLEAEVDPTRSAALSRELKQIIDELGLSASIRIQGGS
jgi:hypothetical protein